MRKAYNLTGLNDAIQHRRLAGYIASAELMRALPWLLSRRPTHRLRIGMASILSEQETNADTLAAYFTLTSHLDRLKQTSSKLSFHEALLAVQEGLSQVPALSTELGAFAGDISVFGAFLARCVSYGNVMALERHVVDCLHHQLTRPTAALLTRRPRAKEDSKADRSLPEAFGIRSASTPDLEGFGRLGLDGRRENVATRGRLMLGGEPSLPTISVICTTYNAGRHIADYLSNISTALRSMPADSRAEIICVDGGSTDDTPELLETFAAAHRDCCSLVLEEERQSIYRCWNRAISLSNAALLTNANADDLRDPDSFLRQARYMQQHASIDVAYADFAVFVGEPGNYRIIGTSNLAPTVEFGTWLTSNPPHHAPVWRRSLHELAGPFDERLHVAGDYDLWVRAAIQGASFSKRDGLDTYYFNNPSGLSTGQDCLGDWETLLVRDKFDFILQTLQFLSKENDI